MVCSPRVYHKAFLSGSNPAAPEQEPRSSRGLIISNRRAAAPKTRKENWLEVPQLLPSVQETRGGEAVNAGTVQRRCSSENPLGQTSNVLLRNGLLSTWSNKHSR
ncbi:hypothetical protein AGOR_G00056340 [Albula goreensis]|uniref:Uncharacterized protein n=1 Tax=Albula goreensis TaxID=1534307 RepID=A0A8T3DUH1_9TELE|nr:hypothetical protein AGOR_G00056340 [Albula goreensis]